MSTCNSKNQVCTPTHEPGHIALLNEEAPLPWPSTGQDDQIRTRAFRQGTLGRRHACSPIATIDLASYQNVNLARACMPVVLCSAVMRNGVLVRNTV